MTDPVADRVFLPVQHMLFALGDVAAILRSHVPLFPADPAVVTVQARGLRVRHLALPHVAMDAAILVREARVDRFAARMRLLSRRVGEGGAGQHRHQRGGDRERAGKGSHDVSPVVAHPNRGRLTKQRAAVAAC
ncbi:hypothetical protein KTE10_03145 [Burkholderia multivorans]|nr:hypothetical protein [Burkholderia multivorans]